MRELLDVLRRLDERGQGDLPVWVSMGSVFGRAEALEVTHRGEWRGVLISDRGRQNSLSPRGEGRARR